MKPSILFLAAFMLLASTACNSAKKIAETKTEPVVVLSNKQDSLSYAIGTFIGRDIVQGQMNVEITKEALAQGIFDTIDGKPTLLSQDESARLLLEMTKPKEEMKSEEFKMLAEKNAKEGSAFLRANAKAEGVVKTDSGLQYKILREGTGDKPKAESTVVVHYKGTFIDGSFFDNSYERGAPASFPLNKVIPGWTEGLQLMSVGSKFQFFIPPSLAYKDAVRNSNIPPNATLIYEVELIDILK